MQLCSPREIAFCEWLVVIHWYSLCVESRWARLDTASAADAAVQLLLTVHAKGKDGTGAGADEGVIGVIDADTVHCSALQNIGRLPQQTAALK